jgi:hypothetical protein
MRAPDVNIDDICEPATLPRLVIDPCDPQR